MEEKNVEDIFKKLGLENLPDDKKEELLNKMGELMLKRIFIAVVDRLDEEGKQRFIKMVEEGRTPEEIEEFLKIKIENHEKLMEEIAQEVETEMVESGNQ